jgi:2-C-methyl-D-erythritol 4-phosphate cytidylyltransferase/2-C-methyl-D-erythritol 2,4-cyclodiphosphate synthase
LNVAAIIVAAGRGSRAAAAGAPPKQFVDLAGKTVLARSIMAFARPDSISTVVVVIHPDDRAAYETTVATLDIAAQHKLQPPCFGGATRQASVFRGLTALKDSAVDRVLIHDAARPFVTSDVIERVVQALGQSPGALAAIPVTDTLKRGSHRNTVAGTVDRAGLWRAQTPQGFRFAEILDAHARADAAERSDFTDDAAIAEWAGLEVALVRGADRNVKITTEQDIAMARTLLERRTAAQRYETRSASGFDVHRFEPGNSVWLCGVEIPHDAKLEGHSDADVGLHALTDALLGAIGAGDIGQHFPPSDMKWKDAASHIFLAHAGKLVAQRGGRIVNVDVTILAEAPRVGPHRAAMCSRIAECLGIAVERVSVKATTTEGLGFTGRREGIAAMATASVELPLEMPA